MNAALLTYEGYALYAWGRGYKSEIDGQWRQFDTAGQWVQYINILIGKTK
jgi:hypothetical protein